MTRFLPITLLIGFLAFNICPPAARAVAPATAILAGSVKPVEELPQVGAINPHRATIARHALKAEELETIQSFEVNLKMRNFAQLEARIANGEHISLQEMAARYEPLESNYKAVVDWLEHQGFVITRRDSHHMAIFARASVAQIQKGLNVNFARVTFEGKEFSSAISTPSVPAELSPLLIGINGLQPHIRLHKHILRPQGLDGSAATYLPSQVAAAYGITALYNSDIRGYGQTIAIVIDTFPAASDLVAYWKAAGVNQSLQNIQFVQAVPGFLAAPSGEETLDTEWSSAMAPGARVRVYAAFDLQPNDLDAAYQQVYDDVTAHPELGIHQMSMSFGEGESFTTQAQVNADDVFFAELAAAGVTVFASSGDEGSTPGANGNGDDTGPLQAQTPASDPNVTGVGGTTLVLTSSNSVSSEKVWNGIQAGSGAGGGGTSVYFSKPSWQTGTGVSGTSREVPDVAAAGDPNFGGLIIQGGVEQDVGGTSWSSPTWAAMCAMLNQARADAGQSPIGILGPNIYPLLSGTSFTSLYHTEFRDITTGNNATPFSGGKYSATAGYDLCTGLGAPSLQALAKYISGLSTLTGVQGPPAMVELMPGQEASLTVSATGGTLAYQWQRMPVATSTWTNLSDDNTFTGSATANLVIANVSQSMSGDQFQCLVTSGTIVITTVPPTSLIVEEPITLSKLAGVVGATGLNNGNPNTARFNFPSGVALDGSGNIYVADFSNNQIRKVTPAGIVSAPFGDPGGAAGNSNGAGTSALFSGPNGVAISPSGIMYVADSGNNSIRKIINGNVGTLATGFNSPEGVAVDSQGDIYVADSSNDVIKKVTPTGTVITIGGQRGVAGFADGSALSVARFNNPVGVAVDNFGNVYVADLGNAVVRMIASGTVSTVAGQANVNGYLDASGTSALFDAPVGVATDSTGNVYIADSQVPPSGSNSTGNCLLRKLSQAGVVSTLAGQPGVVGSTSGSGTAAELNCPQAITITGSGQYYVADTFNQTIRTGTQSTAIASGTGSIIALSGQLGFGNVAVGGTVSSTFTIFNNGNAPLVVSSVDYPSGFSGDFTSGTIAGGDSQTVNVSFSPASESHFAGNITVNSNAIAGNANIAVSGAGVAAPLPPTIATTAPTMVSDTSATLNCAVNPNSSLTTVHFEYGLDATYGSVTPNQTVGSGSATLSFSSAINGLPPITTFHYRAVAASGTFISFGNDVVFNTLSFSTTESLATGDAAAGVTNGQFAKFGNPAINASDDIAFEATLTLGNGITARNETGIWAQDGIGILHLIAETDGTAPGTSGSFSSFSNPVYNDNESVGFLGNLRVAKGQATGPTSQGIWVTSGSGVLTLVARRGMQAPGYPSGIVFTALQELALSDTLGAIFSGVVNSRTDNRGIWQGDSAADVQLLAKTGDIVGGNAITAFSFLPTVSFVNGQSRNFVLNSGTLACLATFGREGTGILEIAGTNLATFAMAKAAAVGTNGDQYLAFGNPVVNANGYVAYKATLTLHVGDAIHANGTGIWAQDSTGTLQLIARASYPAPGTSGFFGTLDDPVYNDNEDVAFRGTLAVIRGEATAVTSVGVWASSSGTLSLIARQGSQAPGCAAGVTFANFSSVALPNQGGAIILGSLNVNRALGVNGTNNSGIWAVDSTGKLVLIARKGDVHNGKTVTALSFLPILPTVGGQTRNFSQAVGDIAYQATFSDKTTAIFVVVFD